MNWIIGLFKPCHSQNEDYFTLKYKYTLRKLKYWDLMIYFIAAIKLVNKQTQLNSAAPATAWIFFTPAKTKMNLFEHIKKRQNINFLWFINHRGQNKRVYPQGGGWGWGWGETHSLICLQIQPSCGGGPPPPELNNPNVELHTHVIINELCLHPF